jgi:hypothetical protein
MEERIGHEEAQMRKDSTIRIRLDFQEVVLDDLADLLHGIRSALFRSLILFLKQIREERDSKNNMSSRASAAEKALSALAISYDSFMKKGNDDPHWRFRYDMEPLRFDEWTRELARQFPPRIIAVSAGSLELDVTIAAMAFLLAPLDWHVNYSLVKDMTKHFISYLQAGFRSPKPQGMLEAVPPILDSVAKIQGLKKITISVELDKFSMTVTR